MSILLFSSDFFGIPILYYESLISDEEEPQQQDTKPSSINKRDGAKTSDYHRGTTRLSRPESVTTLPGRQEVLPQDAGQQGH
jgi:hypothetical protein